METKVFFPYSWNLNSENEDEDKTIIRVYGLDIDNKNVAIKITNYTPYVYLQLPDDINWGVNEAQYLVDVISTKLSEENQPVINKLMYKKRLYGADLVNGERKNFPFIFLSFKSRKAIKELAFKIRYPLMVNKVGKIKVLLHEDNVSSILQMISLRKISYTDWVKFEGKSIINKETSCDFEYLVSWKKLEPFTGNIKIPRPLIMSFDIEVNSSIVGSMPQAKIPADKVFMISCMFARQGSHEDTWEKYLIHLGDADKNYISPNVILRPCESEAELLVEYAKIIREKNPNIIMGYNILRFDIDYMIKRSNLTGCVLEFLNQGFNNKRIGKEITIKWSSSAFKNQSFSFIQSDGRLFIDLLPLIQRDYSFVNYRLKTVSSFFLGETKDPLTPQGIFKCYRISMNGWRSDDDKKKLRGRKAMNIVGKYCVQDTYLPLKIFEKIDGWIGLVEMSKVCSTDIFSLYTQGQQIKVFSQTYRNCLENNYVVQKKVYTDGGDESYTGAYVFLPKPGVYDNVIPEDFKSMYPNIMRAKNICPSTWVKNDSNIPDDLCHIIEWDDHQNCIHDKVKRTNKQKKMCAHRRFRFLKEPMGVLPKLLENLLNARDEVKIQIKDAMKRLRECIDENMKKDIEREIIVLDKRQWALKILANSIYGGIGVSQNKGLIPFMAGAMCVTAIGREYIQQVSKIITEKYRGEVVYGDTDSNYVCFPWITDTGELWDYALKVAKEVSTHFPKPMELAFEEVIYSRFLILSKKRYMSLGCKRDGKVSDEIQKKGVLLKRRDNSKFARDIYSNVVMSIFHKESKEKILSELIENILKIYNSPINVKDFIITKSVKEINEYIVKPLPEDPIKMQKRLDDLNCTEDEYFTKALPSQAQLMLKMQKRGENVGAGTRLEYVVTDIHDLKAQLFKKIEDVSYFTRYSNILSLDLLYYIKNLINPIDELLAIIGEKNFTKKFYKIVKCKYECNLKIRNYTRCMTYIEE